MRAGLIAIVVAVGIVVIGGLQAFFITNPAQQALVLQFGEVRQVVREPGLHFKIPFVQDVRMFDKRVLDLNVPAQEIIAADQKRLVVDAFLRYRIGDPVRFFQAVNNIREADQRLSTFAQSSLRAVLADATFTQIVREDRPELMRRIRELVANRSRDLGVDVVDMRIRRADLPEANSAAIFDRMRTEREQEATEIRAEGRKRGGGSGQPPTETQRCLLLKQSVNPRGSAVRATPGGQISSRTLTVRTRNSSPSTGQCGLTSNRCLRGIRGLSSRRTLRSSSISTIRWVWRGPRERLSRRRLTWISLR